jgi:phage gpG-like protein
MSRVAKATEVATFRNLGHAAARIRKDAIESIEPSDEPSEPGKPPHTRRRVSRAGKALKGHLQRAIVYASDKETATIGPRESIVGESASAHEHGGEYMGGEFPARPFMRPALERNLDKFHRDWAGSIGE